jgi:hypothetical protein
LGLVWNIKGVPARVYSKSGVNQSAPQ